MTGHQKGLLAEYFTVGWNVIEGVIAIAAGVVAGSIALDWLIKFNLQTVPGVTEVLSLGGEVKQFQVLVRPADLLRYDLSLHDVVESVKANNSNVGAQFIVKNSEMYLVRSVGLAENIADLEGIVLKAKNGTPIYLNQVANVVIGGEIRQGLATRDGQGSY